MRKWQDPETSPHDPARWLERVAAQARETLDAGEGVEDDRGAEIREPTDRDDS